MKIKEWTIAQADDTFPSLDNEDDDETNNENKSSGFFNFLKNLPSRILSKKNILPWQQDDDIGDLTSPLLPKETTLSVKNPEVELQTIGAKFSHETNLNTLSGATASDPSQTDDLDFEAAEVFTTSSIGSVTSLDLTDLPGYIKPKSLGLSRCSLETTAFTDLSQLASYHECCSDSEVVIDDECEMSLAKNEMLASAIRRPVSLDRAAFNTNLIPIAENF